MIAPTLLGLAVSGLGGLLAPAVIRRIPEPAPEPALEAAPEPAPGPAGEPVADPGVEPTEERSGGAVEAPEGVPKVPYAEIAAGRGLGARCALVAGAAGAAVGAKVGMEWALLPLLPLVPVLVALSVVDWRTRLLPTWLIGRTYAGLLVAVVAAGLLSGDHGDLFRAGWGWLVAGVSYFLLWFVYPRGLGYGDVRLSGVLGLALGYVGWSELLTGLYAGFLLGGVGGALLALVGLADRKGVPFGPFMVLGALAGVLVGPWVGAHLVGG